MANVITWNTQKTKDGAFMFRVYSFGYQVPEVTLKVGFCSTRAQAMGAAKRWVRFLKANARSSEHEINLVGYWFEG